MYHIQNHDGLKGLGYHDGKRTFDKSDDIKPDSERIGEPHNVTNPKYPAEMQEQFRELEANDKDYFQWFVNGANRVAFNTFKQAIWQILGALIEAGLLEREGIKSRVAFAKMSVDVFGSFYKHHYTPSRQAVGGGVDCVYIPWPE